MRIYRVVGLVMGLLWIASLWLPAAYLVALHADMRIQAFDQNGWWLLIGGWAAIFVGQPAWFANLLVIGLVPTLLMGQRPPWWGCVACAVLSLASLALLGGTLQFEGGPYRVTAFGIGFYLWLLATLLPVLVLLADWATHRAETPEPSTSDAQAPR